MIRLGQYDFDVGKFGVLLFHLFETASADIVEIIAAQCMADHRCLGKQAGPGRMIGVIMGIDDIAHAMPQFILQKSRIALDSWDRTRYRLKTIPSLVKIAPSCYLGISLAGEDVDVIGDTLTNHMLFLFVSSVEWGRKRLNYTVKDKASDLHQRL